MMSGQMVVRVAKLVVSVASVGLTFISKIQADKVLDAKIAEKVAEKMAEELNK